MPRLGSKRVSSIARKMVLPMVVLLLLQTLLLSVCIFSTGMTGRLNQNTVDALHNRVENRMGYLQDNMLQHWSNLEPLVQKLNAQAEQRKLKGQWKDELAEDDPLLDLAADELVELIRRNGVTGAFVILDLQHPELEPLEGQGVKRTAVYLRDSDPATVFHDSTDLTVVCAPPALTQELNIPMEAHWSRQLSFEIGQDNRFYYNPVQAARQYSGMAYNDLGYWSTPFRLNNHTSSIITYTVPLMLEDGTVYGVVGTELNRDYLRNLLPYDELAPSKHGAYLLATRQRGGSSYLPALSSGPAYTQFFPQGAASPVELAASSRYRNCFSTTKQSWKGPAAYAAVSPISLYRSNTPFVEEEWVLIGLYDGGEFFRFSRQIGGSLVLSLLLSLAAGLICVTLFGRMYTRPVRALAQQVRESNPQEPVRFSPTYIAEVDELAAAIETLSGDVEDNASKVSKILDLTGSQFGVFECRRDQDLVFCSRSFFQILDCPQKSGEGRSLYVEKSWFLESMRRLKECMVEDYDGDELLFCLSSSEGRRWVTVRTVETGSQVLGVLEDVTRTVKEKEKLEFERDYDVLTNLLNRRAFHHALAARFARPKTLKVAALIMMDLDNLKFINDTYGHDSGDQYIRSAAKTLKSCLPPGTLISRMSGDEFYIFAYGYDDKSQLRKVVSGLQLAMKDAVCQMPDGTALRIRASAGLAWYPDDSVSYEQLIKYADFAMYTVKNTTKGEFSEFDIATYEKEAYLLHKKEELNKLIDGGLVDYHFQPLVDARTGQVFAYEALMRSRLETLQTPMEILSLARAQSKLYQIERLTWFGALRDFYGRCAQPQKYRLFVNSIASEVLSKSDFESLEARYGERLSQVVLEITEEERQNEAYTRVKLERIAQWRAALAIDDFGTGYNSESVLLALSPGFVKIDMSIVKNVDMDRDRQEILNNLVAYSHERHIQVIAEGVEQREEMETLIEAGVDYLQGYYLARPNLVPLEIQPDIREQIRALQGKNAAGAV